MPPPPTLEQALQRHGDALYRVALLLAGNERDAARLLRATVQRLVGQPPPSLDLPDLLAAMCAAAQHQEEQPPRQSRLPFRNPPPLAPNDPLFSAVLALPREQRQSLALHLLLGYDAPMAAHIGGGSAEEERSRLSTALQRLARPAGVALPYTSQSDACPTIRRRIAEQAEQHHSEADTRTHLAMCSACRSFERAWTELNHMVEAQLRQALRDRNLPAPLKQELLRLVRPPERWHNRTLLRFGVLVGAMALMLASMVLPGFLRQPDVEEIDLLNVNYMPVDAQTMVQHALDASALTPPQNNGIWYGVWDILWYFGDDTYAPLRAEAWVDGRNPARHRLQLSHSSGGAPYELQLGDGNEQIWYALDTQYQSSLFGSGIVNIPLNRPDLAQWAMTPADQEQARRTRLASGAWDLGAAYLRQAAAAPSLRTLGRQREGGHTVQIVSFSGSSPLEVPSDAPGNPGPTTILLAIDTDDGRLRRVTELVGPRGGTQTGRVTWRLREESWLATANQIIAAFDIGQAWNGVGRFSDQPARDHAADDYLLLSPSDTFLSPIQLFYRSFLLPAVPPPGAEHMLLRLCDARNQPTCPTGPFGGVFYRGPGRWLMMRNVPFGSPEGAEQLQLDSWDVTMQPGKGGYYRAALIPKGGLDHSIVFESRGYSRAELLAVVASLKPFDGDMLRTNLPLLVPATTTDGAARRAMLVALAMPRSPAPGEMVTWRERSYAHQNPQRLPPNDPYSPLPYSGMPETTVSEQWITATGSGLTTTLEDQNLTSTPTVTYTSLVRTSNDQGQALYERYEGPERTWNYDRQNDVLRVWPGQGGLNQGIGYADGDFRLWEVLQAPTSAVSLTTQKLPNGTSVVTATETVANPNGRWNNLAGASHPDEWPYMRDLKPVQILTEFTLPPGGQVSAVKVYAVPGISQFQVLVDGNALPDSSLIVTNDFLNFTLPNGDKVQMPRGTFTSDSGEIRFTHGNTYMVTVRYATASDLAAPVLVRSWELLDERRGTLADAPPELTSGTLPQALVVLDPTQRTATRMIRSQTAEFEQAVRNAPYAVFLFPDNSPAQVTQISDLPGNSPIQLFSEALESGLADRYTVFWNTAGGTTSFSLIQGPADKLRASFRSGWNTPWNDSQQIPITIAGREVEAWLMNDNSNNVGASWLFAEVDGTLIIVEAPRTFFSDPGFALLSSMRRAN